MGTCYLHDPPEHVDDELLYHHNRLMHPDVYTHVERWPDGEIVVADHTLEPDDFTP